MLPQVGLFADGVAVKQAGEENFRVARHLVDGCVLVSVDEICAATRDVFYENRAVPEPAGALALAGLKRWVHEQGAKDLSLAAIVSGANLNFDRLRHIAERAELGDEAEVLLNALTRQLDESVSIQLNAMDSRLQSAVIEINGALQKS